MLGCDTDGVSTQKGSDMWHVATSRSSAQQSTPTTQEDFIQLPFETLTSIGSFMLPPESDLDDIVSFSLVCKTFFAVSKELWPMLYFNRFPSDFLPLYLPEKVRLAKVLGFEDTLASIFWSANETWKDTYMDRMHFLEKIRPGLANHKRERDFIGEIL